MHCSPCSAGNPTNIIVAQAYGMTFIGYSKWMVVPTFGEWTQEDQVQDGLSKVLKVLKMRYTEVLK